MMAQLTSGALQQLDVAFGHEIGADFWRHLPGAIGVLLRESDPFHRRMTVRDLAAEQPDAPAADDRETELFGLRPHERLHESGRSRCALSPCGRGLLGISTRDDG